MGQTDQREQREQRLLSNGSDIEVNLHHLPDIVVEDWIEELTIKLYDREVCLSIYRFHRCNGTIEFTQRYSAIAQYEGCGFMAQNVSSSFCRLYRRTTSSQAHVMSFGELEKQQKEDDDENHISYDSLRIVIDHFSYQLGRELNSKGVAFSPNDMTQKTSQMWEDVLNKHGVTPKILSTKHR